MTAMICATCRRRVDPNRSFCTNCGSAVFVDEIELRSRVVSARRAASADIRSQLRSMQHTASSIDRRAIRQAEVLRSLRIVPLIKFALLLVLVWYAASWLLKITEVRALKDAIQTGRVSDEQLRAAKEALRLRLEAALGGGPMPEEPPPMVVSRPPFSTPPPPGAVLPGNGVSLPRVLYQERPSYTTAALRAKVQGTVTLLVVVQPNGAAGDTTVVRSLDARFGLDQQAIAAVRRWRFAPGQRAGQPVPVLVQIDIPFATQ